MTSGRWSEASRASREWTIRTWRISTGPRTNALSSEASGQYAGNERNRDRGVVTCAKPGRGNLLLARVWVQSLKSPTFRGCPSSLIRARLERIGQMMVGEERAGLSGRV